MLHPEKNAVEIPDTMDIYPPEKCINPNKHTQNRRIGSIGS
jgi:hypothetical protein